MDPYYMPFVWLAIAFIMGIVEAGTSQLVSIWFVLGAVAAAITCIFTDNIPIQIAVFIIISLIALAVTRPFVKKITQKKAEPTNSDRYIGMTAEVISEINNQKGRGQVNVSGSVWSARSVDNSILPEGKMVVVEKIEGVKLIVKEV